MSDEQLSSLRNEVGRPKPPEDAGEYADGLSTILSRIPLGWGRWISCDKGWYPMLVELDQRIAEILPYYELHQVKEKFGTLRYYIGLPDLEPQCCLDIEAQRPHPGAIDPRYLRGQERTLVEQYEIDTWFYTIWMPHLNSEDHAAQLDALEPIGEIRRNLFQQAEEIINRYEDLSAMICETCSASGSLVSRDYWYKTLCPSCAREQGYSASEKS